MKIISVKKNELDFTRNAYEFYQKNGDCSSFMLCLFKLIEKADSNNIVKLAQAYPEEVYIYMQYAFGNNESYFNSIGLEFKLV